MAKKRNKKKIVSRRNLIRKKVVKKKIVFVKKSRNPSNKPKISKVKKLRNIALQKTVKADPKRWAFNLFKLRKK